MKNLKITAIVVFATAMLNAQDLKTNELPSAVQNSFSQAYTNVKDVEWEKKGDHFKVEFEINRMEHDVWYDDQGKVMKSEKEISANELPSDVAAAIKTKYPDYKIDSVEVKEEGNQKVYKVEIEKGWTKERKLFLDSSGKILNDLED